MNCKQFIFTLSVALLSGLMGGVLSIWFLMPPSVLAQDGPQRVIEAQEFRVVDKEGTVRAHLVVYDDTAGPGQVRFSLMDQNGQARASSWVLDNGSTGMFLNTGIVLLSEIDGMASLSVTSTDGMASLSVKNKDASILLPSDVSSQRVAVPLVAAETVAIRDDQQRITALFATDEDGNPSLKLLDLEGNIRVSIGATSLTDYQTGSTIIRPVSSLVLFDKEGRVVWSAP